MSSGDPHGNAPSQQSSPGRKNLHIAVNPEASDTRRSGSSADSDWAAQWNEPHASGSHRMSPGTPKKEDEGKNCFYITCGGQFRTIIDFASLFAVIYCTIIVPYDMCFTPPKGIALVAVDVAIEMFFLCEMMCNFVTSYFDDSGEEVTEYKKMAVAYMKGWFIIDAASSVPGETLGVIVLAINKAKGDSEGGGVDALAKLKAIRILRLTKLLRLAKMAQILETLEFNLPALAMNIGLFRLAFTMFIVSHMNACLFYWIGTQNLGNSWISKYMFGCCDTSITLWSAQNYGVEGTDCFDPSIMPAEDTLYVDSLYWSLTTLATVGYGDITPCNEMEQLYTTFAMVVGSAMFAYIVGSISTVATASNGQEAILRHNILQLQEYLELRKIPNNMAKKIRLHCILKWKSTVFDEEKLLSEVEPRMKRKILELVKGEEVTRIPLVATCPITEYRTDIIAKLRIDHFGVDEVICDFKDMTFEMHIIREGKADCFILDREDNEILVGQISKSSDITGKAGSGDGIPGVINELGMLAKEPSRIKVVAKTYVDSYLLRRVDFEEVTEKHTEAREFVDKRIAEERARIDLLVSEHLGLEMENPGDQNDHASALKSVDEDQYQGDSSSQDSPRKSGGLYFGSGSGILAGKCASKIAELKHLMDSIHNKHRWCKQSMIAIMESKRDGLRPSDVEMSMTEHVTEQPANGKEIPTGRRTPSSTWKRNNGEGGRWPGIASPSTSLSSRPLQSRSPLSPGRSQRALSPNFSIPLDISQSHWV